MAAGCGTALGGPSSSASIASISSWLLATTGAAAGLAAGGGEVADFAGVAGGIGRLGAAAADGFGGAAGSGALAGLLASSSAMMRRMEARISSIDGSCAFAVCVITQRSRHTLYVPHSDSAATVNANRCRIPFIRQRRADLADGMSRPSNELWTRYAASPQRNSNQRPSGVRTPAQVSRTWW